VEDSELRLSAVVLSDQDSRLGLRLQGARFRFQGSGFGVQVSGFRDHQYTLDPPLPHPPLAASAPSRPRPPRPIPFRTPIAPWFGVQGLGLRVWNLRLGVWGLILRVRGLGFGV